MPTVASISATPINVPMVASCRFSAVVERAHSCPKNDLVRVPERPGLGVTPDSCARAFRQR